MIDGFVLGDAALAARLAEMPAALDDGLGRRLARFAIDLRASVAEDRLDRRVLRRRSGAPRLDRGLEINDVSDASGPRMALSATAPYAAFQEYGFRGTESVAGHLRAIKKAFGKPLKEGARAISIRAHTRQVDYPAHSFLRAALHVMQGDLVQSMSEGVVEELGKIAS